MRQRAAVSPLVELHPVDIAQRSAGLRAGAAGESVSDQSRPSRFTPQLFVRRIHFHYLAKRRILRLITSVQSRESHLLRRATRVRFRLECGHRSASFRQTPSARSSCVFLGCHGLEGTIEPAWLSRHCRIEASALSCNMLRNPIVTAIVFFGETKPAEAVPCWGRPDR